MKGNICKTVVVLLGFFFDRVVIEPLSTVTKSFQVCTWLYHWVWWNLTWGISLPFLPSFGAWLPICCKEMEIKQFFTSLIITSVPSSSERAWKNSVSFRIFQGIRVLLCSAAHAPCNLPWDGHWSSNRASRPCSYSVLHFNTSNLCSVFVLKGVCQCMWRIQVPSYPIRGINILQIYPKLLNCFSGNLSFSFLIN